MRKLPVSLVLATTLLAYAHAQNPDTHPGDNGNLNGSLSHGDLERLSGNHNKSDKSDTPAAHQKAKSEAQPLVRSLNLSCEVSDARLVVSGKVTSNGKPVDTKVYEVGCHSQLGYLLEASAGNTLAISCLSAEEARAADVARGQETGFYCKLPQNADVYAMVSYLILINTGSRCEVKELKAFGHSQSRQTDFSEVACKEGSGFLLEVPKPGSASKVSAMNCNDAAKEGIQCRMTEAAPTEALVTLDTLKAALKERGESCAVEQIRSIGQEDHRKRYVVEYLCAGQASGKIAFIPLPGNNNPYESVDCQEAPHIDLECVLSPKH